MVAKMKLPHRESSALHEIAVEKRRSQTKEKNRGDDATTSSVSFVSLFLSPVRLSPAIVVPLASNK